jgi:hypothetical protein
MKRTLKAILALAFAATAASAQDTNFAVRISCDFQQQAGAAELPDLTLLQGSAPMIQAAPMRMGRSVAADSLTTCQLVLGPSATSTYYVATNAYLATNSAYYIQLGTIGTNSVPAGSNSPAAWWYSILFYRNGGIYWSGSGRLYIERTTATGANGLVWQEWEAGAAKDDIARAWIALLSNEVASIEAVVVNYGTATNTAFRGDWGASVSNQAAQAAGWGDHALAGYLTAETDPVFAASDAAAVTAVKIGNWDTAYGWGDHAAAGYATGTPVYAETDPIFSATNAWLVRTNDAAYTATVAKAASAVQPADTNGWVVSSHSGLVTEAQAGQIATNVASGYLPLAGHNGPVVLGTSIRGYGATTNVGPYGFAAGAGTSAGDYGFAAGGDTSAGYYSFAAGAGTSAGDYGFAAGAYTHAGNYGFAAGENTSAGDWGFAAGAYTHAGTAGFAAGEGTSAGDYGFAVGWVAKGADGSFVFADSSAGGMPFSRTNRPNEFSARAAGGVYFDTPMMTVTGTVAAGSFAFGDGDAITNWPRGDVLGATINEPHAVATNDGILAFTVAAGAAAGIESGETYYWTNSAVDGWVDVCTTNGMEQLYVANGASTVFIHRAASGYTNKSAHLLWRFCLGTNTTSFVPMTNFISGWSPTGIFTNGDTNTALIDWRPGSTNGTWWLLK